MHRYNELFQLFNTELKKEIDNLELREPKRLYEPVIYTLNMGGKRIRPVLLLLAFSMYQKQYQKAIPVAIALEMFHNFTLLHDDIMDNAALRRNRNTVHIQYSSNTAILSGDAMSILSYEYLSKYKSDNYSEIYNLFTQTALKICEGQQFDMDFENRTDVSVNDYLSMIELKTAVLLATSLKLGALIANAPESDCNLLYQFGLNLGMAFQLQDDLLDTFGDTFNFGKNIGGDIASNKKTFLMLKAIEVASESELILLNNLLSNAISPQTKFEKVREIFNSLNIDTITQTEIEKYFNAAFNNLTNLSVENSQKEGLLQIANQMMNRKK